jgi:5-methylcytosine-specific restriction endonuclease McrA
MEDKEGAGFSQKTINKVYNKATPIKDVNPNIARIDASKNIILKDSYGNTNKPGSWDIDHKYPKSKGGTNNIRNLQPLNSHTNRSYGNKYPNKPGVGKRK